MGNPNNNKTKPAIEALQKTIESITSIKTALVPFLKVLKNDNQTSHSSSKKISNIRSNNEQLSPYKKKEADAAVALAVGTLRYMGERLKGLDRGRKKDDPLRQELDKIRGMLVSLKALKKLEETTLLKKDNTHTDCVEDAPTKSKSNNAKRKLDDDGKEKKKSSPTKKQKR